MAEPSKLRDRSPSSDPLAELARLIGQDDVFEQMRRDAVKAELGAGGPQRSEPARSGAVPARDPHPLAGHYANDESYEDAESHEADQVPATAASAGRDSRQRYSVEPESRYQEPANYSPASYRGAGAAGYAQAAAAVVPDRVYAAAAAPQMEPNYADGPVDPYYAAPPAYDDQLYAEDYAEQEAEPAPKKKRGGALMAASIIGLAVVGTAGAYAYRSFAVHAANGAPPVIAADKTPAKVAPAATANDTAASRPVFDRSASTQTAKIVSNEEAPIELREARTAAPKMVGIAGSAAGVPTASAPATTASVPAGVNEPKKVRTFAIRPDGSIMSDSSSRSDRTASADSTTRTGVPTRGAAAPTRSASIPVAASSAGTAPAAAAGTHVVQLASQKTESEAQSSFRALQAKYPSVLGGREPLIRRVNLGERGTFYRAQVGPFASSDSANEFCSSLKSAGGQCIVQRN